MTKKEITAVLRGMNVAQIALAMGAPNFEERLRLLADEITAYLDEEEPERDGVFVGPEKTEPEDSDTYGGDEPPRLTRAEVLHRAEQCVCSEREQDYGTPEDNFETIAEFWETYLSRACVDEAGCVYIDATDVAMMMALLKIARIAGGSGTRDSFIDLAGYAACGGECADV